MISICIPIYNVEVTKLVTQLHLQATKLNRSFEILLMDDASEIAFREINQGLAQLSNVRYIQLPVNVGRSIIRNRLAEQALYPYLIFMDCDAAVVSDFYLQRYLPLCHRGVVCFGGTVYASTCASEAYYLHWLFGTNRESAVASERNKHPNRNFVTFHFLIDKALFSTIQFDERLKGYGHEDSLFGIELQKQEIVIQHIDNPLEHIGLETNQLFLQKTEQSIQNLILIARVSENRALFIRSIKLLRIGQWLDQLGFKSIFRFLFIKFRSKLLVKLTGKSPKLIWLDLYKLGYLASISTKNQDKRI